MLQQRRSHFSVLNPIMQRAALPGGSEKSRSCFAAPAEETSASRSALVSSSSPLS